MTPLSWTLIIYIYAGVLAKGDSVAVTHVDGFSSQQQCQSQGSRLSGLTNGSYKEVRFVCLEKK